MTITLPTCTGLYKDNRRDDPSGLWISKDGEKRQGPWEGDKPVDFAGHKRLGVDGSSKPAQLAGHQGQQQQTRAASAVEVDDSHDDNLEETAQQQPPHSATVAEDKCDADYVAFLTKVFDLSLNFNALQP